jgi:hypothetical protein
MLTIALSTPYSQMIPKEHRAGTACLRLLTNARFRRRPSSLLGQPLRLASEDPLQRAGDLGWGLYEGWQVKPSPTNLGESGIAGATLRSRPLRPVFR